jgi:PHS family inorganic phosphate transporter-like MFS transporter
MTDNLGNDKILGRLDKAPTNRFHLKAIFVAGMGFFTDAYDLFAVSTALPLILAIFSITGSTTIFGLHSLWIFSAKTFITGMIGAAALFGAFVGALIFGRIGDIRGRKFVYGIEMAILVIFAIVSALSVNVWMLIVSRFILGIGVGGDYPISSTIMSEYSNIKSRGKMVQAVFAMQGFGLLLGAVIGLVAVHLVSGDIAWRIMLGFGAIPAASVIYLRRKIKETPRYSLYTKGDATMAAAAVNDATGKSLKVDETEAISAQVKGSVSRASLLKKYSPLLVGTAGSWLLFDMAFYGTSVNNSIVQGIMGFGRGAGAVAAASNTALFNIVLALLFEIPGYWIAFGLIDKVGRKRLQWIGFTVMAVIYFLFAYTIVGLKKDIVLFIGLYGLSYLFANIGPNSTTFLLPTELFPTQIRTTAHGISASAGKLGAGLFTFFFASITATFGLNGTFGLLGGLSLIAIILTFAFIKETKGQSLEQTSGQDKVSYISSKT